MVSTQARLWPWMVVGWVLVGLSWPATGALGRLLALVGTLCFVAGFRVIWKRRP